MFDDTAPITFADVRDFELSLDDYFPLSLHLQIRNLTTGQVADLDLSDATDVIFAVRSASGEQLLESHDLGSGVTIDDTTGGRITVELDGLGTASVGQFSYSVAVETASSRKTVARGDWRVVA